VVAAVAGFAAGRFALDFFAEDFFGGRFFIEAPIADCACRASIVLGNGGCQLEFRSGTEEERISAAGSSAVDE